MRIGLFLSMAFLLSELNLVRAQITFPQVYLLYSSGEVLRADYLFYGVEDKKRKGDFNTLLFTVIDYNGEEISHRTVHFLNVKYFLLQIERWPEGAEYAKERFAQEGWFFVPIVLTDNSSSKAAFLLKNRNKYYLKIYKVEKVKGSYRRRYLGKDYLFNQFDNYGKGELLVVATTKEYLEEAKNSSYVQKALKRYRRSTP